MKTKPFLTLVVAVTGGISAVWINSKYIGIGIVLITGLILYCIELHYEKRSKDESRYWNLKSKAISRLHTGVNWNIIYLDNHSIAQLYTKEEIVFLKTNKSRFEN